eukprot:5171345-Pyramimonas_sp.AAC.1
MATVSLKASPLLRCPLRRPCRGRAPGALASRRHPGPPWRSACQGAVPAPALSTMEPAAAGACFPLTRRARRCCTRTTC